MAPKWKKPTKAQARARAAYKNRRIDAAFAKLMTEQLAGLPARVVEAAHVKFFEGVGLARALDDMIDAHQRSIKAWHQQNPGAPLAGVMGFCDRSHADLKREMRRAVDKIIPRGAAPMLGGVDA